MDPHVVSERQHQLQQYIRELQTLPDVFKSFHVQLFLERVRVDGKVCLITGASGGIGQQTALSLAMMGAHVIMACRSAEKSNPIVEQIKKDSGNTNVEFMKLDLSSLQSVREFVSEFKTKGLALNILILNAGVLGDQGLTHDGFEMAFGVNYLGHFMLTKLLMDVLHNSVPARVVIVASEEHYNVKSIPYDKVKTAATITTALEAYQVSKLACILFCLELTRRTENTGILVTAVSPGTVATNLFRNLPAVVEKVLKQFTSTIEEGIRPILYCAVSDEMKSETGHHIVSTCRRKLPNPVCQDPEVSATLWNMSESWLTDILMSKSLIF
jgi:retinol dehydrogenase-12